MHVNEAVYKSLRVLYGDKDSRRTRKIKGAFLEDSNIDLSFFGNGTLVDINQIGVDVFEAITTELWLSSKNTLLMRVSRFTKGRTQVWKKSLSYDSSFLECKQNLR